MMMKWSIQKQWKNALSHDWIPRDKAKTFPLKDFYVELRWSREVKGALKNNKTTIDSLHEMINVMILGKRSINILVEGTIYFIFYL